MSPFLSLFTLVYPFNIGIKGGICFEKEGFFRPSFFLEERRIFSKEIISPLNLEYDSINLLTKSNSLGINLRFYIKEKFFMLEFSYAKLFQVFDIFKDYEYLKTSKSYEGLDFSMMFGRNIKKLYIATGIEYLSITKWTFFKIESGILI